MWWGVATCTMGVRIWSEGATILLWLLFLSVYTYSTKYDTFILLYQPWTQVSMAFDQHLFTLGWYLGSHKVILKKRSVVLCPCSGVNEEYRNKLSMNLCMCEQFCVNHLKLIKKSYQECNLNECVCAYIYTYTYIHICLEPM